MPHRESIQEASRRMVERLSAWMAAPSPSSIQLERIAGHLSALAASPLWAADSYRAANAGETRVHELAVSADHGPSLYLVSDGVGVTSPPHGHTTWAAIAGIRGHELNRRYRVESPQRKTVVRLSDVDVGPGDVLVLGPEEIHSTAVGGAEPTFHLHLYGCPLHEMPPFESRCYTLAHDA